MFPFSGPPRRRAVCVGLALVFGIGLALLAPVAAAQPCIPAPDGGCLGPTPPQPPTPNPAPTPTLTPTPNSTPTPAQTPTSTPQPSTPTAGPPQNPGPGRPGAPSRPGNVSVPNPNGSGGGPIFPSPEEWAEDTAEWIVGSVSNGMKGFIEAFNHLVFGLPAPGEADDPETWSDPRDGWWPGVWNTYLIFMPIAAFMAVVALTLATAKPPAERRQRYKRVGFALAMILFGFYIVAALLHLGNSLSVALAPSAEEFFETPGSTAKLGIGVVLGLAVVLVETGVALLGIAILFVQYFLVHILMALWPLFWGLRALPFDLTRPFGDVGIAAIGVLILLKIFQTAILRFLFEIPWDAGHPGSLLFSLVGTIVGLVVATLLLPVVAMKKMLPAAMIAAGTKASPSTDRIKELRGRARQGARDRVGGVLSRRGGGDGGGGGGGSGSTSSTDRRQIGTVQRRASSYSRPGGRAGAETRSPQVGPLSRRPPENANRGFR